MSEMTSTSSYDTIVETLPHGWRRAILAEVAEIRISNVDKKCIAGEVPVRLCNYIDVYRNTYVTPAIRFMDATATAEEINRFCVEYGDVMITKDSETPDDIGVPSVAILSDARLVCGYHLALFKPHRKHVDPIFLAKQLTLPEIVSYYGRLACGTTRYGLSNSGIAKTPLRLPPLPQQRKVARILTTVDNLIEKTESLIGKYESIKQGMMHDLFTRGVDAHGQLRPPYAQAPELYKQSELGWIPNEWEVGILGDEIGPIASGWSPICDSIPAEANEWAILKTTAVVWDGYDASENKRLPEYFMPMPGIEVKADDILITRKGPVERVGVVVHVPETRSRLMIPDTVFRLRILDSSKLLPAFAPYAIGCETVQRDWFGRKVGLADAQVNINHGILRKTIFPKPMICEQHQIVARIAQSIERVRHERVVVSKLKEAKTGLMQDLLTGKVRVTVDELDEVA